VTTGERAEMGDETRDEPDGAAAAEFLADVARARASTIVTFGDDPRVASLVRGLGAASRIIGDAGAAGAAMYLVGNGGSAAIASHQAVDFTKNGGLRALAFNDPAFLTCFANDHGYENVFAEPLARFAKAGDVLVAISSSGASKSILNAVAVARAAGCRVLGFSGFAPANPLRAVGDVNFYVPSSSYGVVEVTHLALVHSLAEARRLRVLAQRGDAK